MPDEEVSNEESEEEKIEGFIPRLKDEIKLIGQRESYPDDSTSFAHWSIHQFTPHLSR